jgi:Uma2 family endonuclease
MTLLLNLRRADVVYPASQPEWTESRYLAFEADSPLRHEYYNGQIYAMAGASRQHNLISMNTASSLHQQVRQRSCEVYSGDMRVKIKRFIHYTYPDVVMVCGTPHIEDDHGEQLLNPTLIIEILREHTALYDRTLASLQEYLLISQDQVKLEQYLRQSEGWLYKTFGDLEAVVELPSVGCQLGLADVYEKVAFPQEEESPTQ